MKEEIYELVKDKMNHSSFITYLKSALLQESFRYDTVTEAEVNSILAWVCHPSYFNRRSVSMGKRFKRQNEFLIVLRPLSSESLKNEWMFSRRAVALQ